MSTTPAGRSGLKPSAQPDALARSAALTDQWIDGTYLPHSAKALKKHFAPLDGPGDHDRHVRYYTASASNARRLEERRRAGQSLLPADVRLGRQMEKDERFWVVAALLAAYYDDTGQPRVEALAELMRRTATLLPPDVPNWEAALAGRLELTFETNLSSPERYRRWLRQHVDERTPIPHLRDVAMQPSSRLEGPTHVDALLLAPDTGVGVLFEAKVLSDVSTHITYDVMRNQIARNIDVMLEETHARFGALSQRRPDRSYFVLLTPRLLQIEGTTAPRLYGHLMKAYRAPDCKALKEHLPHRKDDDLSSVPGRLGWITWEDVAEVVPGACAWLPRPAS